MCVTWIKNSKLVESARNLGTNEEETCAPTWIPVQSGEEVSEGKIARILPMIYSEIWNFFAPI